MKYTALLKKSLLAALCAGLAQAVSAAGPDTAQLERGKTLFTKAAVPACAICHTMADAGSNGSIGPDLDELKPDAQRVKKAMREGMGAMPSFSATMSEDDINAVAAYVVHASGAAK